MEYLALAIIYLAFGGGFADTRRHNYTEEEKEKGRNINNIMFLIDILLWPIVLVVRVGAITFNTFYK